MMQDAFGRKITYLRLSVTELCNLRCRYCMPAEGIAEKKRHEEMLTEDEMILAVQAAVSLGVNKVRLTGGEPLVKKNILSVCRRVAQVDGVEDFAMTTNGILLHKYAAPLHKAGLKRLNISLDTLDWEKYAYITRGGDVKQVLAGLHEALSCGFEKIKLNVVLQKEWNAEEIPTLANLTKQYPVDVRFIELMPMCPGVQEKSFLPAKAVLECLPQLKLQPFDGGVAELYRLPDALGNIGLIRPVSAHFCSSCNRLRITADGMIQPCLHAKSQYSLKGCSLEEMAEQIKKAVAQKQERHQGLQVGQQSAAGRAMNQIGG